MLHKCPAQCTRLQFPYPSPIESCPPIVRGACSFFRCELQAPVCCIRAAQSSVSANPRLVIEGFVDALHCRMRRSAAVQKLSYAWVLLPFASTRTGLALKIAVRARHSPSASNGDRLSTGFSSTLPDRICTWEACAEAVQHSSFAPVLRLHHLLVRDRPRYSS